MAELPVLLFVVLLLPVLVYLVGPRPRFRPERIPLPDVPSDPAEIEQWLARSEAAVDDIIPGTEKALIRHAAAETPLSRAGSSGAVRTTYAVVYLHGFSASPREIDPFPRLVADTLGANLFYTRLTGHGNSDPDAMARMTADDWFLDAVEALAVGRAVGKRVVLVATSTGATLATVLAQHYPELVHALVAVSPNWGPANRLAWLTVAPWGTALTGLLMPRYLDWKPASELHRRYWTTRYPGSAIGTMMSLVAYGRRIDHRRLRVPLIQFSAPGDRVVVPRRSIQFFKRWGTRCRPLPQKRLVLVHDSTEPEQHVITGEIRSPENTARLAAEAVRFLQALDRNHHPGGPDLPHQIREY